MEPIFFVVEPIRINFDLMMAKAYIERIDFSHVVIVSMDDLFKSKSNTNKISEEIMRLYSIPLDLGAIAFTFEQLARKLQHSDLVQKLHEKKNSVSVPKKLKKYTYRKV